MEDVRIMTVDELFLQRDKALKNKDTDYLELIQEELDRRYDEYFQDNPDTLYDE